MSGIPDTRRKKLEALRMREAAKARISRLEVVLTQKMVAKYCHPAGNKRLKSAIVREVRSFLEGRSPSDSPSGEDISRLEEKVRKLSEEFGRRESLRGAHNHPYQNSEPRYISIPVSGHSNEVETSAQQVGSLSPVLSQVSHDWRAFAALDQIEDERAAKEKAEKLRLKQAHLRLEFKRASEEQERAKKANVKAKAQERKSQDEEKEKWQTEERKKAEEKRRQIHEQSLVRAQQIEEAEQRRRAEREEARKAEEEYLIQAKKEMADEKKKLEAMKLREKSRMARIIQENKRNEEIKRKMKMDEAEYEKRMQREMEEMQEKEQARRTAAMAARMKRYEDIGNYWMEQGAGKAQLLEEQKLERMILEEAARREEELARKEKADAEKKRLRELRTSHENSMVIQEVRAARAREREEERKYAMSLRDDSRDYMRAEKEAAAKKRVAMLEYRKQLESQVEEAKERNRNQEMSDIEYQLNVDKIKRLAEDLTLQEQVGKKLGIST